MQGEGVKRRMEMSILLSVPGKSRERPERKYCIFQVTKSGSLTGVMAVVTEGRGRWETVLGREDPEGVLVEGGGREQTLGLRIRRGVVAWT